MYALAQRIRISFGKRISEAFPLNRVVAAVTPVAAMGAATVSSWLVEKVPQLPDSQVFLSTVFVAAALSVVVPAYKWLTGWQQYEQLEAFQAQTEQQQPEPSDPPGEDYAAGAAS